MNVPSSAHSGRSSSLGVALAGFLGVLAGSLLTVLVRPSTEPSRPGALSNPAREHEPDDASRTLAGIESELQAIRLLLESLHTGGEDSSSARVPARDAGAREAADGPDLEAMLAEAISALQRASAGGAATQGLVFPSTPPSGALPDPDAPGFDEQMQEMLLGSYQQVLDLYGKPDQVQAGSGSRTTWLYRLDGEQTLYLHFNEGLLFHWN